MRETDAMATVKQTAPVRWEPDGVCFRGNPWARVINLPDAYVDPGLEFTAPTEGLPDGVEPTVTVDLDAKTVVISMTEEQTAQVMTAFRWWLRVEPGYGDRVVRFEKADGRD